MKWQSNGTRQLSCSFTCRYIIIKLYPHAHKTLHVYGIHPNWWNKHFLFAQLQHCYLLINLMKYVCKCTEWNAHHHAAVFNLCCIIIYSWLHALHGSIFNYMWPHAAPYCKLKFHCKISKWLWKYHHRHSLY